MGYARTVKAATAAAAALLVAAGVMFVGPAAAGFVAEELPRAQAAASSWLTPPYLYLVINAIIISIAASSRFQTSGPPNAAAAVGAADSVPPPVFVATPTVVPAPVPGPAVATSMAMTLPVPEARAPEAVADEQPVVKTAPAPEMAVEDDEFLISRSAWTQPRRAAAEVENEVPPFADLTNSREKPLSSTRFSRKPAKPSPEGSRALRVSRPRKEDTLESTWKAITEGRAPPLARRLKKSDTFETRRQSGGDEAPAPTMRKAETFNDNAAGGGERKVRREPSLGKVRREPSLGQDELNRRVEAFINKFNMEMRLQRQEPLKHYNEMVGSGGRY